MVYSCGSSCLISQFIRRRIRLALVRQILNDKTPKMSKQQPHRLDQPYRSSGVFIKHLSFNTQNAQELV